LAVDAERDALPWWAEAAAEPASALALALAALVAWQAGAWAMRGPILTDRALAWLSAAGGLLASRITAAVPPILLELQAVALLPAVLVLAIALYRTAERRAAALASPTAP